MRSRTSSRHIASAQIHEMRRQDERFGVGSGLLSAVRSRGLGCPECNARRRPRSEHTLQNAESHRLPPFAILDVARHRRNLDGFARSVRTRPISKVRVDTLVRPSEDLED